MGRARVISNVRDTKMQGNTTYIAPEGLFRKKIHEIDYYQGDVFAVGCVLYRLFYGHKAPWQDQSYFKDKSRPVVELYDELTRRIREATENRRNVLEEKARSEPLSDMESYEHTVLKMLAIDPHTRESAHANRLKIQLLLDKQG
jgi:serine/threonine protein kinase